MSTRCRFERLKDGKQVEATHTDLGQFNDWLLCKSQWEFAYGLTVVTEYPLVERNAGTKHERLLYETAVLEREHGLRLVEVLE